MTNSLPIVDVDHTGASADGVMHITAMTPADIATTMFDLEAVFVRNPAGEISPATRVIFSEVGLGMLRHEISREIRRLIKQERQRSLREHH